MLEFRQSEQKGKDFDEKGKKDRSRKIKGFYLKRYETHKQFERDKFRKYWCHGESDMSYVCFA